ncbi:MAG: N-acyl-D-amino-acid deacylase family protein [Endozoicomonas sp.]
MSESFILTGGTVVDGTGQPAFTGDILVEKGAIRAVSRNALEAGQPRIDCRGKVVAPGFIDMHSHMDFFAAAKNPAHFASFTRQGITSFVAGNCGFSPCALLPDSEHQHLINNSLFREGADDIHWQTFAELEARINSSDIRQGIIQMAGHGSCRTSLSGFDDRQLSRREFEILLGLLEEALQEGAAGVSLGLQYRPGIFASKRELTAVAELVQRYDRLLSVHARAYSALSGTYPLKPFGRPHNLLAIDDMLDLARVTGVKLQFSHLIFAGLRTWKTFDRALDLFDQARAEGLDIMFDIFPYPCGATLLNSIFPDWFMSGMPDSFFSIPKRLRLKLELGLGLKLLGLRYDDICLSHAGCPEYKGMEGESMAEIARVVQRSPLETVLDIMEKSDTQARVLMHRYYGPGLVERLMTHEAAIYATDAWPEPAGVQNPAAFGAFPRFLQIARETGNLSLEQCIRKMTGLAAGRVGLNDRGILLPGRRADITVFDWQKIQDRTDTLGNNASPAGIEHVIIRGETLLGYGVLQDGAGQQELALNP